MATEEILFPNLGALMHAAEFEGLKVTSDMVREAVRQDDEELGEEEAARRMKLLAKRSADKAMAELAHA